MDRYPSSPTASLFYHRPLGNARLGRPCTKRVSIALHSWMFCSSCCCHSSIPPFQKCSNWTGDCCATYTNASCVQPPPLTVVHCMLTFCFKGLGSVHIPTGFVCPPIFIGKTTQCAVVLGVTARNYRS